MSCFEMVEAVLQMGISKLGASSDSYEKYSKKPRNDNKAVSKKCVRSEEVPKHFKFKCKRDVRNLKYMRWSIRRHVEAKREALLCMF